MKKVAVHSNTPLHVRGVAQMRIYSPLHTKFVCAYNASDDLDVEEELEEDADDGVLSPLPQEDEPDTGIEEEEYQ